MSTERKDVKNITNISDFRKVNNIGKPEKEKPASLLKRQGNHYPVDSLGSELASIVKEIQRVVQAPMGICAQSVLASVSYATQSHANVHIDSQIIPLSLFFFTVAQSGERKSAADGIACKPIADYERELQAEFLVRQAEYEQALAAKINMNRPRDPILLMQEPTFEGLIKAFETGQASLALFSDEGGHFISGHAMNADNRIKTATGLSSLWDGAPVARVRASQPSIKMYDKRLAFHLMIQPGIALKFFGDKQLVDQGFISRCLLTYPESTMGNRMYVSENIFQSEIYKRYAATITRLLKSSRPTHKAIGLSPEAVQLYLKCYYKIEAELDKQGELRDIAGFANKMLNQVCRLAGVMAIYADINTNLISAEIFNNACQLMDYYQSENIRLIAESSIKLMPLADEEKKMYAQKLWDWISDPKVQEKHSPDGLIKLRAMVRNAPRSIRDKKTILELMEILTEYEYVLPVCGADNMWEFVAMSPPLSPPLSPLN